MKIINNLFILTLIAFSGCQTATLTDETANKFIATASQGTFEDSIKIEWLKAEFYASFVVLRSESENGIYNSITEKISSSEVIDKKNIIQGTSYYYKVQGYNDIGTAMYLTEPAKGFAGAGSGFLPPENVRITAGKSTKELRLDWDRVDGAESYEILRSEDNDYFDVIATVSLLHYVDINVEVGKKYYYQITSLDVDKTPSPNRSQTVEGSLFGTNLNLTSLVGAYDDKIVLTWTKYEYATEYLIFRSMDRVEMGNLVKTIKQDEAMEYSDTEVEPGTLYYYTVMYKNDTAIDQSDTVRSYLKTAGATAKPTSFTASQGSDPRDVILNWTAVNGAANYEVARSISKIGPWEIIAETVRDSGTISYIDKNVPNDSYTYFYTITGLNPAPGTISDIVEGWANKPPINVVASDAFGEKVIVTWNSVTNAEYYIVYFSETEEGSYTDEAGRVYNTSSGTISFEHKIDIGNLESKDFFYQVRVYTKVGGQSLPSESIKGAIKKISAPKNVVVKDNRTPTKTMTITWDRVDGAKYYKVYRALLDHKGSKSENLEEGNFKEIAEVDNASYGLEFNTYPIRRYV